MTFGRYLYIKGRWSLLQPEGVGALDLLSRRHRWETTSQLLYSLSLRNVTDLVVKDRRARTGKRQHRQHPESARGCFGAASTSVRGLRSSPVLLPCSTRHASCSTRHASVPKTDKRSSRPCQSQERSPAGESSREVPIADDVIRERQEILEERTVFLGIEYDRHIPSTLDTHTKFIAAKASRATDSGGGVPSRTHPTRETPVGLSNMVMSLSRNTKKNRLEGWVLLQEGAPCLAVALRSRRAC